MKKALALFALLMSSASVSAQTTPAQMGITPTTSPEILQTLDNTKTWVPIGSVDSTTHTFTVVGGGGGGGGTVGPLTLYSNHAALTAGAVTPSSSSASLLQQGFYTPGDGGQAVYQWNPTSFCAGALSGTDAQAVGDGFLCVLPSGQSQSTAGRYMLQMNNGAINAKQLGFKDDGADNGPLVPVLNKVLAMSGPRLDVIGPTIVFASDANAVQSNYWFNSSLYVSRDATVTCGDGSRLAEYPRVNLVFAAGTGGVRAFVQDVDGRGSALFNINGCGIVLQGGGYPTAVGGSTTLTNVDMPINPGAANGAVRPAPRWSIGDGVAHFTQDSYWFFEGYVVNDVLTVTTFDSGWSPTDPGIASGQLIAEVPGFPRGMYIKNTHAEEAAMTGTGHAGTYRLSYDIRNGPWPGDAIPSGLFASAASPVSMETQVQSGDANFPNGTTVTGCSPVSGTLCTAGGTLTLSGVARIGMNGPSYLLPGPNTTEPQGDQSFKVTTSSSGNVYGPIIAGQSGGVLTVTGGAGSLKVGQKIIGGFGGYVTTTTTGALTVGQATIPVASCVGIAANSNVIAFNGGNKVFLPQTTGTCTGTTLTINPVIAATATASTTSGSNVIVTNVNYFNRFLAWKGTAVTGAGIPAGTTIQGIRTAPYDSYSLFVTISNNATATATGVSLTFGGVALAAPSGTTLSFVAPQSDVYIIGFGTGTGGNGTYILNSDTGLLPPGNHFFAYDTPSTIFVTSGPRMPFPQEPMWIDGFPFGTQVSKVFVPYTIGSNVNETIITSDNTSFNEVPGFADHTAGSGKMWLIPSGILRGTQGSAYGNQINNFGVGLNMACATGNYNPSSGCGHSIDSSNTFLYDLIGRLVEGNNSGGSASTFNQYDHNAIADVYELGTVGSAYIGEMFQGQDESSNTHVFVTNCSTGTTVSGAYASGAGSEPSCAVFGNTLLSSQTSPFTQGSAEQWIGPIYGAPFMSPLGVSANQPFTSCTGAPTASFTVTNGIVTKC